MYYANDKIRQLIAVRLREIHQTINGTLSMGDLAVYVGQPMTDAMNELVEFVQDQERQRAVEICDIHVDRMIDRELCAKALRDPATHYPSVAKQGGVPSPRA